MDEFTRKPPEQLSLNWRWLRTHNILDDTDPDSVAGDLLSHIDEDIAEERQRRAEEYYY